VNPGTFVDIALDAFRDAVARRTRRVFVGNIRCA
jgi:hypothetical protein